MEKFSLSWESYKNNICNGLSVLQQNGEFVDMTIAADGHHVKVHKMVMSLVSPYLKELITTAAGDHPVIFLNKVSYGTLCAILEYIYTGEVLVGKDNLAELVEAGHALHIRGLEDVKVEIPSQAQYARSQSTAAQLNEGQSLSETGYFTQPKEVTSSKKVQVSNLRDNFSFSQNTEAAGDSAPDEDTALIDDTADTFEEYEELDTEANSDNDNICHTKENKGVEDTQVQYTISHQGALQMILNRYLYYLRYTSRKKELNQRLWKCMNYTRGFNCPATAITRNDVVIKRFGVHNHPFHDRLILRRVRDNAVFSAISDAQQSGTGTIKKKKGSSRE